MSAARKPELNADQAGRVAGARNAQADIASDKDMNVMNLAGHVGRLQYHVGELLALIAELTGEPACMCTDLDCPDPVHQEPTGDEPEGDDE